MSTQVVMPQMGESVAEGTIVRWLKQVGDRVDRDEPLFEISTDKVDAEIPAPAAGVLTEIRHAEGETVPIHTVVALIDPAPVSAEVPPAPAPSPVVSVETAAASAAPARATAPITAPAARTAAPRPPVVPAGSPVAPTADAGSARQRMSPVVRRIAQEHHVDVSRIPGTGIGGRVTKQDILAHLATPARPVDASAPPQRPGGSAPASPKEPIGPAPGQPAPGTTVPMSVMRKRIAEHMVLSKRTSAHVHSVFEINCHRIDEIRRARKDEFERAGGKLTYLAFIIKAAADALRVMPVLNASVEGDSVVHHRDVNVGIAVALDWGLIVPVIKRADEKDLLGLSQAVTDLAARARAKKLTPDDVQGGTFTVTNPGGLGAQFGLPIINQPQVAILAIGAVEKRVVAIDDAIAIRPMAYFALGYDHRIIDGAVADQFMALVKHRLEDWDPNAV